MIERTFAIVVVAVLGAAAACARPGPPASLPAGSDCLLIDEPARSRITIGVADPGTGFGDDMYSAARLAGAQMHETLVRVDCTGTPTAALAQHWSTPDGIRWHFRIAAGATFADGSAVDAAAIVAAWSAARIARPAAVNAAGAHDLQVTLHAPADVRLFALPELAVVRRGNDGWPQGTGRYTPDSAMAGPVLRLVARGDARRQTGAAVTVLVPDTVEVRAFGGDPRIALDDGVDALITNDAGTIAYARARSDYVIEPLPWNRTYLLATGLPMDMTGAEAAATEFPAALVRAPARPAVPPFWWQECGTSGAAAPHTVTDGRVLYARDDRIGRAIAERITALARDRTPAWLSGLVRALDDAPRAVGVSPTELRDALRSRRAVAVITSLPRIRYDGCQALNSNGYGLLLNGWHVTPLIDTRHDLVYRPGIGSVVVDADGMIRFGAR